MIEPDWPFRHELRVFTTTRQGGASQPPYDSFNLGDHVGDDPGAVVANRSRLQTLIPDKSLHWLNQVHGTEVVSVTGRQDTVPTADAAWTTDRSVALAVLTADCLPVVFVERDQQVVGVAHGGWRGLVAGVLAATFEAMPESRYCAWIGPAIGPSAYEVGEEVIQAVVDADPDAECLIRPGDRPGKGYLDLFLLAERQLEALGVETVYCDRRCTYSSDDLFSYRRDGSTGRMATIATWR